MVIKNTEKIEKGRLATRERVRRYRAKRKQGLSVTTHDTRFTIEAEKTDVTVTLPPVEGFKTPLTLRTVFVGGRWLKILS